MNKALQFQVRCMLKNMVKRTLQKPLKTIGIVVLIIYFCYIPFLMIPMMEGSGFDNPEGFIAVHTMMTLYMSAPVTLTYFKRNGVVFRKQDVNLMFATPISPKQILVFALLKQAYMTLLMQIISIVIAGHFLFHIPLSTALLFALLEFVFSNLLQYSLAVIMYGSERISNSAKNTIKWVVYGVLLVIAILILYYFLSNGFSLDTANALTSHPIILGIPIFGWQLGFLNFVLIGPTTLTTITSILYIITSISLFVIALKMKCTGEYYEDAIKFTQRMAKAEAMNKKGQVNFNEMFGKKRKVHKVNAKLSGSRSSVIFSRQKLERFRTTRFFFSFGDLLMLVAGIVAGIISFNTDSPAKYYFIICSGITMYFGLFFSPNSAWKDEFNSYFLYLIPDTILKKLWNATLLEHCISLIRALLLAIPFGIIVKAPLLEIVLVVIMQVLMKSMITYKSIFVDAFIGTKLGNSISYFINFTITVLLIIVPILSLVLSVSVNHMLGFGIYFAYTICISLLFMYLCTKVLTNLESLKD